MEGSFRRQRIAYKPYQKKYLRSNYSCNEQHDDPEVIIGEDVIASTNKFKYLNLLSRVTGRLMEMLHIVYKRVGLSGEQPLEYYVIERSWLD